MRILTGLATIADPAAYMTTMLSAASHFVIKYFYVVTPPPLFIGIFIRLRYHNKTRPGSARTWRKRMAFLARGTTAVLFGWLAIRLWMTHLPAQADNVANVDRSVFET